MALTILSATVHFQQSRHFQALPRFWADVSAQYEVLHGRRYLTTRRWEAVGEYLVFDSHQVYLARLPQPELGDDIPV